MDIVEKFIRQISYKFPKGYPDMNNEHDVVLLNSLLERLGVSLNELEKEEKPDYDSEILNLLTTLSDDEVKKKVITYLNKVNKAEDKDDDKLEENIIEKLKSKNLTGDLADLIVLYADKFDNLKALSDYLNKPTITHSDLLSNNTLSNLFKSINLSNTFKDKIINLAGSIGNVAVGKGEIALVIFLKDAEKYKTLKKPKKSKNAEEVTEIQSKGDIKIENVILEIKRGTSILAPTDYVKRATKSNLFGSGKAKDFVKKYNIDIKQKITWVSQITSVNADEKEIKEVITEIYPGLNINFNGVDMQSAEEVNTAIGLALAKEYLKDKKLLFINDQNEYACIENYEDFEQLVNTKDISFRLASDSIPRVKYKDQLDENEITEGENIEFNNM